MVVTNKSDAIRIKLMYNKKVRDELKEHKMRYNLKRIEKRLFLCSLYKNSCFIFVDSKI